MSVSYGCVPSQYHQGSASITHVVAQTLRGGAFTVRTQGYSLGHEMGGSRRTGDGKTSRRILQEGCLQAITFVFGHPAML
jgi:hypothetical protein